MAEIVGLAASIGGQLTTAGAALKVAESMFRIARRINGAREEIEDFGREISSFADVIHVAHRTLNRYKNDRHSRSPALEYLGIHDTLKHLVADSRRVVDYIKKLRGPIRSMHSNSRWWTQIKWAWQSRDIKAIGPKMESVKSNLALVIGIVTLEVALHEDDREEISILRRQVKMQLQTIEILQERQIRQTRYNGLSEGSPSIPISRHSDHVLQDFLISLGQSMRENGTVPVVAEGTSSASSSSFAVHSNEGHFTDHSDHENDLDAPSVTTYTSSDASMKVLAQVSVQEGTSISPSSHIHRLAVLALRSHNQLPTHQEKAGRDLDSDTQERSETTQSSPYILRNTEDVQPEAQEPSIPRPPKLTLQRQPHAHMGQAQGFIISQAMRISVTAQLDHSLAHNIISGAHANHLELDVSPEVEAAELHVDGMTHVSTGTVVLGWGGSRRDLRDNPIEVRCYVFEEGVEDIIFGREFVQQRRTYEFLKRGNH